MRSTRSNTVSQRLVLRAIKRPVPGMSFVEDLKRWTSTRRLGRG